MAISYSTLRNAAITPTHRVAKSLAEARERRLKTAFLCHSHADKTLVEGFVNYVKQKGWDVYIDWQDNSLPTTPNRTTAAKIRSKIRTSDLFIFLATHNSMTSRWCPWEIGFADGAKFGNDILVVETIDDSRNYHGSEYLQLYRKLDVSAMDRFVAWEPGADKGTVATSL